MTRIDREILFTSLGFLAVILRGEIDQNDSAKRARGLAWLIEEFCESTCFDNSTITGATEQLQKVHSFIESYVLSDEPNKMGLISHDRQELMALHKYLEDGRAARTRAQTSTDTLRSLVFHLLETTREEGGLVQ